MMGFLAQIVKLLFLPTGSSSSAFEPVEPRSANRPSNALICREAWELQKIRASEAQEGYFQIRASASIVASFASGGAIAAAVGMVSVAKESSFGRFDLLGTIFWILGVLSILLLLYGAYLSLEGALTNKMRDHSHPNLVIDKDGGYISEAQFYRQLIANSEGYINDHREATRLIGQRLLKGVRFLLVSIFLSLILSLTFISQANLSSANEDIKPAKRSENPAMSEDKRPELNEPMPPPQKPMPSDVIEEGDQRPLTIKDPPKEKK